MKHSSLLGQFVSYEENEVLWIRPQGPYSQRFIFFITYELANKLEYLLLEDFQQGVM